MAQENTLEACLGVLTCKVVKLLKIRTNKVCTICGGKYYAKELCRFHYDRKRKNRDVNMNILKEHNDYHFNGEYVEVTYYNKKHEKAGVFLVDADIAEKIKGIKWSYISSGYIAGYKNRKCILLHRFITDCPEGLVVDHINHNKLDNRLANLRICTQKQNMENATYKLGASNIRGITKSSRGYYIAIKNGKYLGCSKDIEIAKSYL